MLSPATEDRAIPITNKASQRSPLTSERRSAKRQTLVLRVGVLIDHQHTTFCVVTNISSDGAEVKFYSAVKPRSNVQLTVGDEDLIDGQVAWVRGGVAGVTFTRQLDPGHWLRAAEKIAGRKRRCSPRVNVPACALVKANGRTVSGQLANISTAGAKVRTSRPLDEGLSVSLILPDLPAIMASVRWSDGHQAGLLFRAPLAVQSLAPWLASRLRVSA